MPENPDAELLGDALGIPVERMALRSREPLGGGSVTGFGLAGDGAGDGGTGNGGTGDDGIPVEGAVEGAEESAELFYFVDTSRLPVERETGLTLGESDRPEVRIWQHPADPHLPALPAVSFAQSMDALIARAGRSAVAAPELVAYRPGRRAVLRVACTHGYLWVKVVRPSRVERVVEAHRVCSEAGIPVPALLMWSPDGVIVCETADGRPAAETEWRADALLDEVDELRLRLASVRTERPVRGIRSRLDWYASRLGRAAVDAAGDARAVAEIDALVERARRGIAAAVDRAPLVPVHGDLHFGQLFLGDAGRIAGVIDVDTLGLGDRAEDPAAFLGHAIASALLTESELALRVWELADAAAERWGSDPLVPPLTAVHLLGHALGATDRGDERMRAALLRIALAVMDGRPPSEGAR